MWFKQWNEIDIGFARFCLNNLWGSLWLDTYCGRNVWFDCPRKVMLGMKWNLYEWFLYEVFSIISCAGAVFFHLQGIRFLLFCLHIPSLLFWINFTSFQKLEDEIIYFHMNKSLLKYEMTFFLCEWSKMIFSSIFNLNFLHFLCVTISFKVIIPQYIIFLGAHHSNILS